MVFQWCMQTSFSINHELKMLPFELWFLHNSFITHPLFPTQETVIFLTRKIQTDCTTNWLWLLKTSFELLAQQAKPLLMKRVSFSHMVLERSTIFWLYCTCENNKQFAFLSFPSNSNSNLRVFKEWI